MPAIRLVAACVLLMALSAQAQEPSADTRQRLVVSEDAETFRLSVPASPVSMTLPRGGLKRAALEAGGAASSPRYFAFSDPARLINVSGWFEPASSYRGVDSMWSAQTEAWRKGGLPDPVNASISKIDGWDVITYELAIPMGNDAHVRAELVRQGTWIDLHISAVSIESAAAARAVAMGVFKSIRITESP